MSSTTWLLLGVITGAIGLGYTVYGKKNGRPVAFIAGLGLMVYPYVVESLWLGIVIGLALILAPWFIRLD